MSQNLIKSIIENIGLETYKTKVRLFPTICFFCVELCML